MERMLRARAKSLDVATRTVRVVIATSDPVPMGYDYEALDISGVQLGEQVPLLDAHRMDTAARVIGSVRDIVAVGDTLEGTAHFADTRQADDVFRLVRDGHLTDYSVGYEVLDIERVQEGSTSTVGGKTIQGPAVIARKWRLLEVSAVPVGADPRAKARSKQMEEEIVMSHEDRELPQAHEPVGEPIAAATAAVPDAAAVEQPKPAIDQRALEAVARAAAEEVAKRMMSEQTKRARISPVSLVADEDDKFAEAAADALFASACHQRAAGAKLAPGAEHLSRLSFSTLAQECLRRSGRGRSIMSRESMYEMLLGRRSAYVPTGYATTADFPQILANTANKALISGFQYEPTTYQAWAAISDVADFKPVKRISVGAAPELLRVNEGAEVTIGAFGERAEELRLYTYARRLVITRQALINDDLSVFERVFASFGARAAALANSLAYAVINDNPTMSDGKALFHADHGNMAGTASALSFANTDNLGVARAAMRKQRDSSGMPLNIMPRFLIVGPDSEKEAALILNSMAAVSYSGGSGYVAQSGNAFAGSAQLVVDANVPDTRWFLAASPVVAPVVEVIFLDGKRTPTLTEEETSPILGIQYRAVFDVGAGAVDWRGMYRNG